METGGTQLLEHAPFTILESEVAAARQHAPFPDTLSLRHHRPSQFSSAGEHGFVKEENGVPTRN